MRTLVKTNQETLQPRPNLPLSRSLLLTAALVLVSFAGALWLYVRTAPPSVLSGDRAEFQFAAPLLGVPHPTGYPLYIMLGKLMTFVPIGDIAHRVTLLSVVAGAAGVALLALLVHRVTRSLLAALVAALSLTVAPGFWNAATLAEVYALNVFLLILLALLLYLAWDTPDGQPSRMLYLAALVAGLGFGHHGSFALTGVPLLFFYGVVPLFLRAAPLHYLRTAPRRCLASLAWRPLLASYLRLALCFALGLTPWLLVMVQFARFGPFAGPYHGLPQAYFWGAPTGWGEALLHLVGGGMRAHVFDLPGPGRLLRTVYPLLWERMLFEFGPPGIVLGSIGGYVLLRRPPWLWLGCVWVMGTIVFYLASLTGVVQDALEFTVPMLLPWALWVGVGAAAVAQRIAAVLPGEREAVHEGGETSQPTRPSWLARGLAGRGTAGAVLVVLLLVMLAWGQTRLPYGNKADLWLFRSFGETALHSMEPDAAVLVRWEQGTILHYLRLVEQQRPDVLVDIVEPEDLSWQELAQTRYADRPVYIIGSTEDGERVDGVRVWGTDYATLFRIPQGEP